MKLKTHKIPIYFGEFTIVLCDNYEEINIKYGQNINGGYQGLVFRRHGDYNRYVVAFNRPPAGSIIAHEAVHLTSYLFKDIGHNVDTVNDEPQAYMVGWFYEQIEKFFKNIKQ